MHRIYFDKTLKYSLKMQNYIEQTEIYPFLNKMPQ